VFARDGDVGHARRTVCEHLHPARAPRNVLDLLCVDVVAQPRGPAKVLEDAVLRIRQTYGSHFQG